jgi:protein-L-isoaspartate(D-aspartate) O-methyltransferase
MLPDPDAPKRALSRIPPCWHAPNGDNRGCMSDARRLADSLRGAVRDERVLDAIAAVPRALFVRRSEIRLAYENCALPIGYGQTISQPQVVARMLAILGVAPDDRVLDVGTGSGYHAAILARLAAHVWSIERIQQLSDRAASVLADLGVENVSLFVGDGSAGLPEHAPFDAINVAAAVGSAVPPALEQQLAPGGRLVAPVGDRDQRLVLCVRTPGGIARKLLDPVRFVPLIPTEPD